MSTELKLRRDVVGDIDAMTPAEGEPIYDITNKRLQIGDGSTAGGIHLAAAADIQKQVFNYAAASGTDTLTLTLDPAIASYTTGLRASFKAAANNTGTATININGLGAKTIKKNGGVDLGADDIVAGGIYETSYDGTNMQLFGRRDDIQVIASGTVSRAASLDFINLSADYRAYMLVFDDLLPVSDAAFLWLRTDTNNGASFDEGASDYAHSRIDFPTGGTVTGTGDDADKQIIITSDAGNASSEGASGQIVVYGPADSSTNTKTTSTTAHVNSTSNMKTTTSAGFRGVAAVDNAFQLLFSTGNISTMNYTLYGLRAT